jgi:hypothetical protein
LCRDVFPIEALVLYWGGEATGPGDPGSQARADRTRRFSWCEADVGGGTQEVGYDIGLRKGPSTDERPESERRTVQLITALALGRSGEGGDLTAHDFGGIAVGSARLGHRNWVATFTAGRWLGHP